MRAGEFSKLITQELRVMYTNIGDKNNLYRTGTPACHTIIIQLKLKHGTDGRYKKGLV